MNTSVHQTPSEENLFSSMSKGVESWLNYMGFYHPAVVINCTQRFRELLVVNDMTIAQAFRRDWLCQPLKQPRIPRHAVCHVDGVINKIYKDLVWEPEDLDLSVDEAMRRTDLRWRFTGNEELCFEQLLNMDMSLLSKRTIGSSIRYVNMQPVSKNNAKN
jgi:hypothetical protein